MLHTKLCPSCSTENVKVPVTSIVNYGEISPKTTLIVSIEFDSIMMIISIVIVEK